VTSCSGTESVNQRTEPERQYIEVEDEMSIGYDGAAFTVAVSRIGCRLRGVFGT
jgi:hypothetical protein